MTLTTTLASELTAEQVQSVLVQPLEQASTFLAAGPKIVDTAGPLRIPTLTGGTAPGWYGQNEQIAEDDVDFGEITLLPTTMKSVKVVSKFSNELTRQSVIALESAIRARVSRDVAAVLDAQFLSNSNGDAGTKPRGIFNYAGQTVEVDGALTLDHMIDADALALSAHVDTGALRWLLRPETLTALRKVEDNAGRKFFEPDSTRAGGLTFLGHSTIVSDRIPAGLAGLVNFGEIVVARDQAPSIKVLDQTWGDFDVVGLRTTARYDVAPVHSEAVIALTGITG
ncbi:phage major capsid protein [Nocardioides zeae]